VKLDLVLIPAGEFLMGDTAGDPDEWPVTRVKTDKPFWMGKLEVTNAQFACFDPDHDSAYISEFNKDQSTRGQPVNRPHQPVLRVSWDQALAFARWLSEKTGERFTLPTEAQWEYACRAGSAMPMNYGALDADFSKLANLADAQVNNLCRKNSPRWIPCIATVTDGATVTDSPERWQPNAWGLHGMHGNVAEWTLSIYRPYPYKDDDGRNDLSAAGSRVVRGGSFYDRPALARSASRHAHPSWQHVFDVGFRVVAPLDGGKVVRAR